MFSQIIASGTDARTFLQGQLTQDVAAVTPQHSPLAAWCSPQGRVIATLRLMALTDGVGLVMPFEMIGEVIAGLSIYRLRAQVTLQPVGEEWRAQAVANAADIELLKARQLLPEARAAATCHAAGIHAVCPTDSREFVEVYGAEDALAAADLNFLKPLSATDWQAARIAAGITDIVPATSRRFTPHMLNLDRLGALSFAKGCYTGQEIVARTQHLGSVKRRVARFRATAPVALGDPVSLDGTTVGEVVAAAHREVLAVLPVALQEVGLHAADVALQPA